MNVNGRTSYVNGADHYLSRQLILKRDNWPFGSEIRINHKGREVFPPHASCPSGLYSEILMQTRSIAFSLKDCNTATGREYFSRRFVCVEQSDLIDSALVEELIQSGEALNDLGQTLAIVLNELPLSAASFKNKKKILHNVYLLKDHGVEIALDHYSRHDESSDIITTLGLFNYIKIPVSDLDLSLKLNGNPELFNRLHERMITLSHNTKVSFIADRVENTASHILARALPFDYFQGSYYSPIDNL